MLDRLREAFPSRYRCTSSDHVFDFGSRAKVYVRKRGHQTNTARIWAASRAHETDDWTWHLSRYPNGDELRRIIGDRNVGALRHMFKTKVEYLFGPHNVGRLIETLRL